MELQIWLERVDGKEVHKPLSLKCGENCHQILTALHLEAPTNSYSIRPVEEVSLAQSRDYQG